MVYCHILDRYLGDNGADQYTVELIFFDYKKGKPLTEFALRYDRMKPDEARFIDTNVPRRAIKWNEIPFQDDEHLENVFRHPIGFPDELWPKAWAEE